MRDDRPLPKHLKAMLVSAHGKRKIHHAAWNDQLRLSSENPLDNLEIKPDNELKAKPKKKIRSRTKTKTKTQIILGSSILTIGLIAITILFEVTYWKPEWVPFMKPKDNPNIGLNNPIIEDTRRYVSTPIKSNNYRNVAKKPSTL